VQEVIAMQQQAAQAEQQGIQEEDQAKKDADRLAMERKGAIDIEKEIIRGENKRSMLKEVPIKGG